MIPDISGVLAELKNNPSVLQGMTRGIEREALRIHADGSLAATPHPALLGSALTHEWITTDFAEQLLELVTPPDESICHIEDFLRDIHHYVASKLDNEYLWPLSMPCSINHIEQIKLAQYGHSNIGRAKSLYRQGLKLRYGALMQIIAGVHFNFSFPTLFWQALPGYRRQEEKAFITAGYLRLTRNYYRFGWIIPYLFGASPAVCESFLQGHKSDIPFQSTREGELWLPHATSLRLSNLGYTNHSQNDLVVTFNSIEAYTQALKQATNTPSARYNEIGLKNAQGDRLQINTNILQIENEYYAPIRPKRVARSGEIPSDLLLRKGIQYVEVRSLDINPFSAIGIDDQQIRLLDLLLIWCVLAESPEMETTELQQCRRNWRTVVLQGRKPGQHIEIGEGDKQYLLAEVGVALINQFSTIAKLLDSGDGNRRYQQVCDELASWFTDPEHTFSARLLQLVRAQGQQQLGVTLAKQHHQQMLRVGLQTLTEAQLDDTVKHSFADQRKIELSDTISFENYLSHFIG